MVALNIQINNAKVITKKDKVYFDKLFKNKEHKEFLEEKEKKAYDRGFSEGREKGFSERNEEVKTLINTLLEAEKKMHDTKFEILNLYEPEIIKLAVEAAERLVFHELEVSGARIDSVVKETLNKLPGATNVRIKLNPEDLTELLNINNDLLSGSLDVGVEFIKDASISKGGCLVESDVGDIDALIETRIENVKKDVIGEENVEL